MTIQHSTQGGVRPSRTVVPRTRGGALDALRAHTCDLHERVDAAFADVAAPGRYPALLVAMARVWPALEDSVARHLAAEDTPAPRVHLLRADLAALGLAWPPSAGWPHAGTLGGAVGAWYVLAGSRLGGSVLARRLRTTLGVGTPAAFLIGETRAGAEWGAFCGALEPLAAAGDVREAACSAARDAFGVVCEAAG